MGARGGEVVVHVGVVVRHAGSGGRSARVQVRQRLAGRGAGAGLAGGGARGGGTLVARGGGAQQVVGGGQGRVVVVVVGRR